ncbi:182 kDa tankyrase-1-binding protein isoform X2 [Microcaecilia unicolor]|nr:182 kDa tankyrase-1-binding protein isoform X2 [Microcaecilia unicolor]XP_030043303.1 182 kDa tankyrase-1-binding protein isoform X2 [Microcaecilia unicolor]XP_030043312.1 182 kDa tankyrase-1-binding protein isoform X2 [Microcaecilia unicolor]XP_030043322.1 182 kDa tankyrase-1-binding protein isoform X2 [Microcaecilia unicolor]XP_030043330.1 182 kDa tankyrase-1-binding protein isoform X2 [Microcaecilia unicolor]XP_030043340.1 182 kDa tankyrase-1-binding protein isoform X2 [Microcaecilia uni
MASEPQLGATVPPEKLDIGQTPPKPLLKPKPRLLPKPAFPEKPVTSPQSDGLACSSCPGLYSPKSPLADVPLAEKINILTGPKPYGSSTTAGLNIKRPSFTFKRQKSETISHEGNTENIVPIVSEARNSLTFSEPPKAFVPWRIDDTDGRKPDCEELSATIYPVAGVNLETRKMEKKVAGGETTALASDLATAERSPEQRKAGPFRVKPVPVAVKPGRFPGTTVEEILARMEEGKTASVTQGPDRSWAQRQSLSFDGGSRFGSKAYSSFRRQQSITEAKKESEEKAAKEVERKPGTGLSPTGVTEHLQGDPVRNQAVVPVAEEDRAREKGGQSPDLRSASQLLQQPSTAVFPLLESASPAVPSKESCILPASSWDRNQFQGQLSPPRVSTDVISNNSESPSKIEITSVTSHTPRSPVISPNGTTSSETPNQDSKQRQGSLQDYPSSALATSSLTKVLNHSDLERDVVPDLSKEGVLTAASVETSNYPSGATSIPPVPPRPSKAYSEPDFVPGLLIRGVPLTEATMESSAYTSRNGLEKETVSTPVVPNTDSDKTFVPQLLVRGSPVKQEAASVESSIFKDTSKGASEQGGVSVSDALLKETDLSSKTNQFTDLREHGEVESVKTLKTAETVPSRKEPLFHPHLDSRHTSEGMLDPSVTGKGDVPAVSEQALAGSDWSLSESFEWSSPSRSTEWTKRRQSPTTSPIEEMSNAPNLLEDNSVTSESDRGMAIRNETLTGSDHETMQGSVEITERDNPKAKPRGISNNPPTNWSLAPSEDSGGGTLRQRSGDGTGFLASENSIKGINNTVNSRQSPYTETAGKLHETVDPRKILSTTEVETLEMRKEEPPADVPTIQGQKVGVNLFEAKEVSKSHSEVAEFRDESENCHFHPSLGEKSLESVEIQRLLEPVHPILQSEPAAEACVMFNKVIHSDHVIPSWEEDSYLSTLEPGTGTSMAASDLKEHKLGEEPMSPSKMTEREREAQFSSRARELQDTFDISDFDPVKSDPEEKPTEVTNLDSQWLEKLLSPTPANSDVTERDVVLRSKDEVPSEGQEGLLGWAQKDLRTEFGVEEPEKISTSDSRKRVWDNEFSIGGTHQSSDFSITEMDQSSDYGIAKRVWERDFGIQSTDQSRKFDIEEPYMNKEFGLGETSRDRDSGLGETERDFSLGVMSSDRDREFGLGVTSSDREFGLGVTSRDREFGMGETDRDVEFGLGETSRDRDFGQEEVDRDFGLGEMSKDRDFGLGERDRDFGLGKRDRDFGLEEMNKDFDLEERSRDREFCLGELSKDRDREFGLGELNRDREFGLEQMSRDRDFGLGETDRDREYHMHSIEKDGKLQGSNHRDEYSVPEEDLSNTFGTRDMDKTVIPGTDMSDFHVGFTQDSSSLAPRYSQSEELFGSSSYRSHGLVEELLGTDLSKQSSGNEKLLTDEGNQIEVDKEQMDFNQFYASHKQDHSLEDDSHTGQLHPSLMTKANRTDETDETDAEVLPKEEWLNQEESVSHQAEGQTLSEPEEMEEASSPEVDFTFLGEVDVLDSSACRSRAFLNRKRGHRAPVIRPGATLNLNLTESDGMFQDSTEPKPVKPESSDEEVAEPETRRMKKSPVAHGVKLGLFSGFNPLALKAKLKQRKSVEEGEQVESKSAKESQFQRSKSCKVPASGKPAVLPPKPEKSPGSESSSPQWLKALKIKKRSTK